MSETMQQLRDEYRWYLQRVAIYRPEEEPMVRSDWDSVVAQWNAQYEAAWEAMDMNTIRALEWALCV